MPTKPYDKGSANDSVPALTDSGSVSYPVGAVAYGTEGGTVTIVGAAGLPVQAGSGAAFPVTDNGGSLTVDGTVAVSGSVAVTGTFWQATQPVSIASTVTVTGSGGTFPVTDGGGSLTVDGTVAAMQSGAWTVTGPRVNGGFSLSAYADDQDGYYELGGDYYEGNATSYCVPWVASKQSGTWTVTGSGGTFPVTDSGGSLTVDDGGGSLTVDGTVAVSSVSGSVAVTGTFWQATQPVSIASTVTVTGAGGTFPVTDNGGSLTVDGTVAATQSGTWTVTGSGGTFPVTDSGGSLTVDAPVGTPVFVRLSDGANATPSVVLADGGSTFGGITTAGSPIAASVLYGWSNPGNSYNPVPVESDGGLRVSPSGSIPFPVTDNGGSLTVDNAGTFAVNLSTAAIDNAGTSLTPKFAAISASSSGNNTLVSAVTSKKIRVLAYNFIGAGAVNAKFQSGASGTDLTGLKYIAAAGGGICAPFNPLGWFETGSGVLLNLNLSGAVAVGGELVYVEV